jgi:hypothetical protein
MPQRHAPMAPDPGRDRRRRQTALCGLGLPAWHCGKSMRQTPGEGALR